MDTSAILALVFDDPHATWVANQLEHSREPLLMSTVNLTEALIRVMDINSATVDSLNRVLLASQIRFVAPDERQATIAADARHRFPLNLGDCFVYALARAEQCGIITTDRDFRSVDAPVLLP